MPSTTKINPAKYWIIVPDNDKWADMDVDLYRSEQDAIDAARAACSCDPIQPYHVLACIPVVRAELTQKIDVVVTSEKTEE